MVHGGGVGRPSTAVQLEEAGRAGGDSIRHASWNDAADPEAFGQPRHRAPFVLVAESM